MSTEFIVLNGMRFTKLEGEEYPHDYYKVAYQVKEAEDNLAPGDKAQALAQWTRALILAGDLFFISYFIYKNPLVNTKFGLAACKDVMYGPKSHTNDLWARGHLKTTILGYAENTQKILANPESRIGIFSYTQPAALSIQSVIQQMFESSALLKLAFPDVLYEDPKKEAYQWSDEGIYVKRTGFYREPTLSAYGLLEGLPTGPHFTDLYFDDVMVEGLKDSPEQMTKLQSRYHAALQLVTLNPVIRNVGTTYDFRDLLTYLKELKDKNGELRYKTRIKPATDDGTFTGKSVFIPEEDLDNLRLDPVNFAAQQLLMPNATKDLALNPDLLVEYAKEHLPRRLIKFLTIDATNEGKTKKADYWSITLMGISPVVDKEGNLDVYILDMYVDRCKRVVGMRKIVEFVRKNPDIVKIFIEKVGMSTMEVHIENALKSAGKPFTVKNKRIMAVGTGNIPKQSRITAAIAWPLELGKIGYVDSIDTKYIDHLKEEMKKFPVWHDDCLDGIALGISQAKAYKLHKASASLPEEAEEDKEDYQETLHKRLTGIPNNWMYQ